MGTLTDSLTDNSPYDYVAMAVTAIMGVLLTAGIGTVYGYDLTQTFGGFTWLSVPVLGLILSTVYIWATNEALGSGGDGMTDVDSLETDEVVGTLLSLHLVVLEVIQPTFYTNAIFGNGTTPAGNVAIAVTFVILSVVGNQILSNY